MIHKVKTATIRDLRTRFPKVRAMVEQQGEIIVTDHGQPVFVLRPYDHSVRPTRTQIDYYARLKGRMPRALTTAERSALDEANRGER